MFGKNKEVLDIREINVCNGAYTVRKQGATEFFKGVFSIDGAILALINAYSGDENIGMPHTASGLISLIMPILAAGDEITDNLLNVISRLSGIDSDAIKNDPAIGFNGIVEIITALIKMYGLKHFFGTALPEIRSVWQGSWSGHAANGATGVKH